MSRFGRPGRRALVAADLSTLQGPTSGVIELPHRMVWAPQPAGRFDLSGPYNQVQAYETVLREAVQYGELQTWLNMELLVKLWP